MAERVSGSPRRARTCDKLATQLAIYRDIKSRQNRDTTRDRPMMRVPAVPGTPYASRMRPTDRPSMTSPSTFAFGPKGRSG